MATDALLMQMDADADAACCCIEVLIMMESGDGCTSGNLNGLPGAKRPLARVGKLAASSDCLSLLRPKHKEHKEGWIPNLARRLAQHRHTPDKRGSVWLVPIRPLLSLSG